MGTLALGLVLISAFLTLSTTESTTATQEPSPCGCSNGEPVPYKCLPPTNQNCESCDSGYILNESVVVRPYLNARGYSYSAFESGGPTASIWSFLEIFRIIFSKKTEIFEIAKRLTHTFERTVQQRTCRNFQHGESRC